MEKKLPKVGDKYALISFGGIGVRRGQWVEGVRYVTSIRGELISLDRENKPDPKAKRTWRPSPDGDLRAIGPYSYSRAEPWTSKHEELLRRQHMIVRIEQKFEEHKKNGFAEFESSELLQLVRALKGIVDEAHGKEGGEDQGPH